MRWQTPFASVTGEFAATFAQKNRKRRRNDIYPEAERERDNLLQNLMHVDLGNYLYFAGPLCGTLIQVGPDLFDVPSRLKGLQIPSLTV